MTWEFTCVEESNWSVEADNGLGVHISGRQCTICLLTVLDKDVLLRTEKGYTFLYTHKRQNPSHTLHTLVAANHAALHNTACTHTGSYQTHRRDAHPATRGITQLLPSLPLPLPTRYDLMPRIHRKLPILYRQIQK